MDTLAKAPEGLGLTFWKPFLHFLALYFRPTLIFIHYTHTTQFSVFPLRFSFSHWCKSIGTPNHPPFPPPRGHPVQQRQPEPQGPETMPSESQHNQEDYKLESETSSYYGRVELPVVEIEDVRRVQWNLSIVPMRWTSAPAIAGIPISTARGDNQAQDGSSDQEIFHQDDVPEMFS